MTHELTDEQIAGIYRDTFNSWPDRKRDAPTVPPMVIAFARAVVLAHLAQRPTSEPVAWRDPTCPRHVLSHADKRDFETVNSPVGKMKAAMYTEPLYAASPQAQPMPDGTPRSTAEGCCGTPERRKGGVCPYGKTEAPLRVKGE